MRNYSDYLTLEEEHEELSQICARQAVEIERLKARIINFENNGECVHCGAVVPIAEEDVNHWRTCQSHPARVEVERLKAERDQHREGEAALVVERDALWRRADELGREVEQLKWRRTAELKAAAEKEWDVQIEQLPPKPSEQVVVRFTQGAYRPPRIEEKGGDDE